MSHECECNCGGSTDNAMDNAINRRDFVATAAVAAAALGIGAIPAFGQATTQPSTAAPLDVGVKTDYAKDGLTMTWEKTNHVIVQRADGKLFAMSSKCTHRGCDVVDDGTGLNCPCHNSNFSYDGKVTQGPARRALPRFGISVNDDGHIVVDIHKTFPQSKWDDPASYITVAAAT